MDRAQRLADSHFTVLFLVFFFAASFPMFFFCFFQFSGASGGANRDNFWYIFVKQKVSGEQGGPLVLHTIIAFWFGFEGLGPPGMRKQ